MSKYKYTVVQALADSVTLWQSFFIPVVSLSSIYTANCQLGADNDSSDSTMSGMKNEVDFCLLVFLFVFCLFAYFYFSPRTYGEILGFQDSGKLEQYPGVYWET